MHKLMNIRLKQREYFNLDSISLLPRLYYWIHPLLLLSNCHTVMQMPSKIKVVKHL